MSTDRINYLLNQYFGDKISAEEMAELKKIISEKEHISVVTASLEQFIEKAESPAWTIERLDEMVEEVLGMDGRMGSERQSQIETIPMYPAKKLNWKKIAVAASILLVIGLGSYFAFFNKPSKQNDIAETTAKDVKAPDKNRATITLADGSQIYLDSAGNGTLATTGSVTVTKNERGEIVYNGSAVTVEYNTLFNPRGSKIQPLTLSDGTKLWLNAESSVTYPTAFTGTDRRVKITGEVYFEVAHNATKPFYVSKGNMNVEVLGTHFNVNAYDDEVDIKVTLLEGAVKVNSGNSIGLLKPGEQAKVANEISIVKDTNIDEVMAWKNGQFKFFNADIQTILRQVSRWYDLEVVFEKGIPAGHYRGAVSKEASASKMLEIIKNSGVNFRIEGKKLIIENQL